MKKSTRKRTRNRAKRKKAAAPEVPSRRLFFFMCTICLHKRQTFFRWKAERGTCAKNHGVDPNPNQTSLLDQTDVDHALS